MSSNQKNFSAGPPTYRVVTAPDEAELPVSLDELKLWLKITNTAEDVLLQSIINSVTRNAELYTKRTFIDTIFKTKRDFFGDFLLSSPYPFFLSNSEEPIELRRTPITPTLGIFSIKYFNTSNVETTVSTTAYYVTETDGSEFSLLLPEIGLFWPADLQTQKLQQIEIIFHAGWTDKAEFLREWPDLYTALLAHMADVYTNRGDCSSLSSQCACDMATPKAKMVYDMYKVIDFAID